MEEEDQEEDLLPPFAKRRREGPAPAHLRNGGVSVYLAPSPTMTASAHVDGTSALKCGHAVGGGDKWAPVISRVKPAIVAIRVTAVRPFEDSSAGVWHGTGFVVCLADAKKALILTNRHIISTGPVRAFATFDEHEELPIWPVYRDPIHDFGLFQFDATQLRFTTRAEIRLAPSELRVGEEVLVIGNDNVEKIQILPATIARVDRNCPIYDDGNYQDENTFYAGAGSNTSGGSSGAPVLGRSGNCIALNAGGAVDAASAYYLPLDRAVYVLDWLLANPEKMPQPPRGSVLARFLFQPFDMLHRLGFTKEQETWAVGQGGGDAVVKGLLVVESILPGSKAEVVLRPGDILMEVDGEACLNFTALESKLDGRVCEEVPFKVSRAGMVVDASLVVQDLHAMVQHDFVECGGGVFHLISYHTCKRFHLPINKRGVFVAQSGFGFGLEVPYYAVISAVADTQINSLEEFAKVLSGLTDGETFQVTWSNPTTNERRSKHSSVRMERTLWPLNLWRFSAERPNVWRREALGAGISQPSSSDGALHVASVRLAMAHSDSAGAEIDGDGETDGLEVATEPIGYPPSRDPTISRVQPMLCTVTSRVSHEFATDFIQSDEERNSTLIRRCGVGLVVDASRGLVLTDRYTMPQPLMHVELTFAQMHTIEATCLFIHPQHNLVLLHFDPSSVSDLPIRAIDLWSEKVATVTEKNPHDIKSKTLCGVESHDKGTGSADVEVSTSELSIGTVLSFVSLHGDHRLSSKLVTVGSVYLKSWPFAEPPAYRERNLEICNLNDTLQGLGGLVVEPGRFGITRAWFAQFPAGRKHYIAGVATPVLAGLLAAMGIGPEGGCVSPTLMTPSMPADTSAVITALAATRVPAIDCEFEEISVAKARRYHGLTLELAKVLAAKCSDGRRQALMVSRVTAGGECDGRLQEGDVLLRVDGVAATRPQEVERLLGGASKTGDNGDCTVALEVLRAKRVVVTRVQRSLRSSDGTERILAFNGMVLRPTLRAVSERGGPVLPHARPGSGVYFWYIFPGSPADTFGIMGPGWVTQVNDVPTPSIESLLAAITSGAFDGCEWLRYRTVDSEGRAAIKTLQPDELFWPTVEFVRRGSRTEPVESFAAAGPRWVRLEHRARPAAEPR